MKLSPVFSNLMGNGHGNGNSQATRPVVFNNTVLRDGHQSLAATRMTTEQMLPACALLDELGFGALETWGGATIDSGLRFLGEFPFARLDALRAATPKTPHMMLLRGQNIVGYTHYADDVVEAFVKCSAKHGMDIFRIFDALNDLDNIRTAVRAAKAAGKQAHGTICYTSSPVHGVDAFVKMGAEIADMGCDAIVIKDMAGLIPPYVAAEIIRQLKKQVKIPVWLHTHDTAGLGASTYLAAIEAGVDAVDTSIVPFANGTGQPDTARMLALLTNHARRPNYDSAKLQILREHFTKVYAELSAFTSTANEGIDCDALAFQVPGGMLSNFRTQLKEMNMTDRFGEVMEEIPHVREALGWIPLVTPTSQIVGFQAVLNVKFGRWKNFSPQAMDIALGYYGRTPAPVNAEIRALAAKTCGKDPIEGRPADRIKPGLADLKADLRTAGLPDDDEHAVIASMFMPQLKKFYEDNGGIAPQPKTERPVEVKTAAPAPAPIPAPAPAVAPINGDAQVRWSKRLALEINGHRHEALVEELVS